MDVGKAETGFETISLQMNDHTDRGLGGRQYGRSEEIETLQGQNNPSAARLGTVEECSSELAAASSQLRNVPTSRISLRMTCATHAHDYATWLGENLNRFSFCLVTHRFRRPSYLGCKQKLRHAVNDNLGLEDI